MRQKWGEFGEVHPADEILVAYITDMTMQKKVMTKKRWSDFWSEKVHLPRENPGYAYDMDPVGPLFLTVYHACIIIYHAMRSVSGL